MERMPVFVKIDEYQEVTQLVNQIKRKMQEAQSTLSRIHELKNEEDQLVEKWQSGLTEVQRKIDFIDQTLGEPENY